MVFSYKKVAVFGMGRSGLSALKLLKKIQVEVFAINKGAPESWKEFEQVKQLIPIDHMVDEEQALNIFSNCDLIVLSPGIPKDHRSLLLANQQSVPIWSEIELAYFFFNQQAPIIAVTGTNGKTTTAFMIKTILEAEGQKVGLIGTIANYF